MVLSGGKLMSSLRRTWLDIATASWLINETTSKRVVMSIIAFVGGKGKGGWMDGWIDGLVIVKRALLEVHME